MSPGIMTMGLFVGFLVGLTGVGAASLLTPFLVLIGVHPTIAVGTDLVYNSVTKGFGMLQHWRQRTIQWTVVRHLAYGSVPGAILAIATLHLCPWFHTPEKLVQHAVGGVLILVAAITLLRMLFDKQRRPTRIQRLAPIQKQWLTTGMGFFFGLLVGLTSIGSGSLVAVALLYVYRMASAELVGTDIAHAFLLATVAGALNASLGHVDGRLALNLLCGSIPGVLLGSRLSSKVPSKPLRTALSVLILLSGLKMV